MLVWGGYLVVTVLVGAAGVAAFVIGRGASKLLGALLGTGAPASSQAEPIPSELGPVTYHELQRSRSLVPVEDVDPKKLFLSAAEALIRHNVPDGMRPVVDKLLEEICTKEQHIFKDPRTTPEEIKAFGEKIGAVIGLATHDVPRVPSWDLALKTPLLDAIERPLALIADIDAIRSYYFSSARTSLKRDRPYTTEELSGVPKYDEKGRVISRRAVPIPTQDLARWRPSTFTPQTATSLRFIYENEKRLAVDPRGDLSFVAYAPRNERPPTLDATYWQLAEAYLYGTPFWKFVNTPVPVGIPEDLWFEHCHALAPPGTGKTNLLQFLISQRLDQVAAGKASVIVMDSNYDLINTMKRLARFGPGGDLYGRLVFIDAEDVEYPLALNLFDVGLAQVRKASPQDRERVLNAAITLLSYVFRSLLQMEMTGRQASVFSFTIQLLIRIPNATLDTLMDIMLNGTKQYEEHLSLTDKNVQNFFRQRFEDPKDKFMRETRMQVVSRIEAVQSTARTIAAMFAAPRTKLDLFKELGDGKVILINAPKSFLQAEGVELFGRFFLALILMAAEKRQTLPPSGRLPTYLFIDEAQDIIARDEKLPVMLDQARKLKVSVTIAHQGIGQMSDKVMAALYRSTAIKFAARSPVTDAGAMGPSMSTTADFITNQKNHHMAAYIRGVTPTAISLAIPRADFASMKQMTAEEWRKVVEEMRRKYAISRQDDFVDPYSSETHEQSQVTERSTSKPDLQPQGQAERQPHPQQRHRPAATDVRALPDPKKPRHIVAKVLGFSNKNDPDAPGDW
jgi:hypothetical protein